VIGRLQEGYETSFLILADNPLKDFANVTHITRRAKLGSHAAVAPGIVSFSDFGMRKSVDKRSGVVYRSGVADSTRGAAL
jgi:hypothetical protein